MSSLITKEQLMNDEFYKMFPKHTLNELNYITNIMKFAGYYNIIPEEEIEDIQKYFSIILTKVVKDKYDLGSYMIETAQSITNLAPKFINSLNRYFISLDNPFMALESIRNDDLEETIKLAEEHDKIIINKLSAKLKHLVSLSQFEMKYHDKYRNTMYILQKAINELSQINTSSLFFYDALDGQSSINLYNENDIDIYLDKLIKEAKILNKFNQNEIERILKKIKKISLTTAHNFEILSGHINEDADYSDDIENLDYNEAFLGDENILKIILSNYCMNYILFNSSSLRLNERDVQEIFLDVDTISNNEIETALYDTKLDLTQEEIEYILEYFVPYIKEAPKTLIKN